MGYHTHDGGIWRGDYLVADYAPFKKDCDVGRAKVKVHRAKAVAKNLSGKFIFPVAERCRVRTLKEEDSGVPNEPPELVATTIQPTPTTTTQKLRSCLRKRRLQDRATTHED